MSERSDPTAGGAPSHVSERFVEVQDEAPANEHWQDFAPTESGQPEAPSRSVKGLNKRALSIVIAAGVAVVLTLVSLVVFVVSPRHKLSPGEVALGGKQAAALVQVRDIDGSIIGSAIVQHSRDTSSGSIVAVPLDMMLDVDEDTLVTIKDSQVNAGESVSSDALGDLLGIDIDGSYTIDRSVFAALVDRIGGIDIKVNAPVVVGGQTVVSPNGDKPVHVSGATALAYGTYLAPGERSADRAGRFVQLLDGIIAQIPSDYTLADSLLNAVGLVGNGTLTPERLAAILSGAAGDRAIHTLRSGVLPLRSDASGNLDVVAAATMVRDLLGTEIRGRSLSATPRVLVETAISDPTQRAITQAAASAAITNAGYRFIDGGDLSASGVIAPTSVTVYGSAASGRDLGDNVASLLSLDKSVVHATKDFGITDVVVILGPDFKVGIP